VNRRKKPLRSWKHPNRDRNPNGRHRTRVEDVTILMIALSHMVGAGAERSGQVLDLDPEVPPHGSAGRLD
jgi:hypothetical protein